MMTSELPQELLEEILCRVPATSLKRLRTTCKQWNHLFNDKKFLKKHSDKAAKQHLFLTLSEEFRVCLLNINLRNGIPSAEVTGELSLNKVNIRHVSHCDGLLVCTIKGDTRVIVWNPCTGQIKWIQTPKNNDYHDFVLGYYQDKKSCDKSYKILGYRCFDDLQETELYDINSNSWRNLGVTPIPDYHIECFNEYHRVSLKGKAYWFANDWKENQEGLISFDYTRERFERLRLPYQYDCFENMTLSVVGEEKLSVLLREEIWVTTKIDDETKELSWIKLLELEICIRVEMFLGSFVFDQEKKIFTCCERPYYPKTHSVIKVHIIGRIVMPHQGLFQ